MTGTTTRRDITGITIRRDTTTARTARTTAQGPITASLRHAGVASTMTTVVAGVIGVAPVGDGFLNPAIFLFRK